MVRRFTQYPKTGVTAATKPTTFKKFVKQIVDSKNQDDAINNIFYGENGIDMAYQHEYISWEEHQLLLKLIEKLA